MNYNVIRIKVGSPPPHLIDKLPFDLNREGHNNNCSVRLDELDGYCFNSFHYQPPNHRLIANNPFAVNVWRNLVTGVTNRAEISNSALFVTPIGRNFDF